MKGIATWVYPDSNPKPLNAPNQQATITLPETNIAPENGPSQKETSIPTINFQVRKC